MKYMGETVWHATVRFTGSFDFVLGRGRRGWGIDAIAYFVKS